MLKVLQRLDPQGIIFEKITLPIKNYLLKRNDTLRCIISHLTDDIDKYSEMTREKLFIPSKEYIEEQSSEEDENMAKEWQIMPLKEQKIKRRVKYQEIDLVTVLVGLYGSQEAFIAEYQNMMAEKLMSVKDYNIEEELRNIELLKMRFGESALQTCNIILKDVKDSKRNDGVIHAKRSPVPARAPITLKELSCLSVSKGYWPINYENTSTFNMPPEMRTVFEEYGKRFAEIKAMRKIFFHYNLGHVNLTLSFDNGDFEFKCLPIQAIMITYFDEEKMRDAKNGVSSEELSN
jgi:anaphase-promoting complex subunit 2